MSGQQLRLNFVLRETKSLLEVGQDRIRILLSRCLIFKILSRVPERPDD